MVELCKGKKLKRVIIQNTLEFCQNTTIHGLKYVGSKDLSGLQRAFFGLSVIAVLIFGSYFISKTYEKWMESPIIFGINPEPIFITDEPFPAVTICNMNHIMKSHVEHFPNTSKEFAMLQFFCHEDTMETVEAPHRPIYDENELLGFLVNVSQPCDRMITHCRYGGFDYDCKSLFNTIVTSQGICCVFNMLHPKFMYAQRIPIPLREFENGNSTPINWSAEAGYPKPLPKKFFPRTTRGTGESMGFNVILNLEHNNFYCRSKISNGFKILLHSPNETPNVQELGILISPGKRSKVRIRPEKIQTSRNLRSIHRRHRYCLFQDETNLEFFAHYTQRNCEMECISRVMYKYCGCIKFNYPLVKFPICGEKSAECMKSVGLRTDPSIEYCLGDCLPSCTDLTFYADVSTASLNAHFPGYPGKRNISLEYIRDNIALVNMYFKEFIFRSSIQTEFVGTADFMASIGGLLGLLFGFSFISISELFFFAVMRPLQRLLKPTSSKVSVSSRKDSLKIFHAQGKHRRRQFKQQFWAQLARYSMQQKSRNLRKNPERDSSLSKDILRNIFDSL